MNNMKSVFPEAPRALGAPENVEGRRAMLGDVHVKALSAYVDDLRQRFPGWEFPDFDPLDGGVNADMLFLFEKPGPMTSPLHKRQGSGFISRDNNDPTAEAIFSFMRTAGIDRGRTVLWNTIPGWNRTRTIVSGEVREGIEELKRLLPLLPRLRTIVLVGKKAQRAKRSLIPLGLRLCTSSHPGPLVKGPNRAMWEQIPQQWANAATL